MAVMPGAIFEDAIGGGGVRMRQYDVVCIHTFGGRSSLPVSTAHFSITADGRIFQARDTRFKSAANLDGNSRVISIENQDTDAPFPAWKLPNVPPLTPKQIEANARICAWAHQEHGIPLVPCPNSRKGSRGIGYHRQGIPGHFEKFAFPGKLPDGELWTDLSKGNFGKVCPGDARIRQIPQIIKRARVIAGLDAPELVEDDVQLIKGDRHDAVFVVVWSLPGSIAVRKRVPNENDPGFKAAVAAGYTVHTVPQAVIDAIPDFPAEK